MGRFLSAGEAVRHNKHALPELSLKYGKSVIHGLAGVIFPRPGERCAPGCRRRQPWRRLSLIFNHKNLRLRVKLMLSMPTAGQHRFPAFFTHIHIKERKVIVKFKYTVALILIGLFLFPALAQARTVIVENRTGKTIRELYISHVETDDWETDVLRPEESNMRLMHNGARIELWLDKSNFYDLLAVFQDRSEQRYEGLDIRKYGKIILNRYDASLIAR